MKKAEVLKLILLFFGLSKKYTDEHGGGGGGGGKTYTFTDDGDGNITITEGN